MKKTCQMCGAEYEGGQKSKYCPKCRKTATHARHEEWVTIAEAPNYEVSNRGRVRNIKTGRMMKISNRRFSPSVALCVAPRVQKDFFIPKLLWQYHGIIREGSSVVVPVVISKGNQVYHFDATFFAARFIAQREYYSANYIRRLLQQRREEIFGWKVIYHR